MLFLCVRISVLCACSCFEIERTKWMNAILRRSLTCFVEAHGWPISIEVKEQQAPLWMGDWPGMPSN